MKGSTPASEDIPCSSSYIVPISYRVWLLLNRFHVSAIISHRNNRISNVWSG